MRRDLFWTPPSDVGLEHLHLVEDAAGVAAEGVVVGVVDGEPFRVRYEVACDREYRVRRVEIATIGPDSASTTLRADGAGTWTDGRGDGLPALDGCVDADVSATPFTNTLPIRRLDLDAGESTELSVAYVTCPELRVEAATQRYTCLDPLDEDGGQYRFETVEGDFTADLSVDSDGLVVEYPGLFDRISSP